MTDCFAVLDQPRRPWLEADVLKQAYHRLTLDAHPDMHHRTHPTVSPALVNDAYRILQNPKLRLAHLLELESGTGPADSAVPDDIAELFWDASKLSAELDRVLGDATGTSSALARALLAQRAADVRAQTETIIARLERLSEETLAELRRIDGQWNDSRDLAPLRQIHRRLSYIDRWLDQFREKLFQLPKS